MKIELICDLDGGWHWYIREMGSRDLIKRGSNTGTTFDTACAEALAAYNELKK